MWDIARVTTSGDPQIMLGWVVTWSPGRFIESCHQTKDSARLREVELRYGLLGGELHSLAR
jgi:hypothetical protein